MPSFGWSVLYCLGLFAGAYVLAAVGFLLFACLEKDKDGSLLVDSDSLHYRACKKCYGWKMHETFQTHTCDYVKVNHLEYYQIGLCGYFWRVFWTPLLFTVIGAWQTVKTVVYAHFMFLFGYYPWPTIEVMKREGNIFAVEVKQISFPRIGKLELKPYLVVFPALYAWLLWSYPQTTWNWTLISFVAMLVIAILLVAAWVADKVGKSENPRVMLVREYVKTGKRGICPLLKVRTRS
ncbi:MAG: hypothetical protein A2651_00590 [Candidatus Yanofskybacteria bacterium RIFCSPHIGHO2_01_FULL_42_12]|uniref:Uncharacterized protein n=1 Tax=Candidatus Yanofskybacteria bacterium RIFCSPLOWO2_01_FULL_42_49 TaxID=1802694 RepID=A0A1F8GFL6_9BACT|nr:MAG: hypothetical protein A2651_00590 [Candidatus Yanofskybacteria bacterium RIFCSPHIGHO2_01_FULL_42_12]OGN23516.1 MAG: hypothetical protein A2918_00480 [Candidatus Yanofskybacteria bacterium RIFCSPLOWO2_01_FULL_42_49]